MTRWLTRVGWRHLVGLAAVAFSLFPIVFVLSAALNPLGTLSSTSAVPTDVTAATSSGCSRAPSRSRAGTSTRS